MSNSKATTIYLLVAISITCLWKFSHNAADTLGSCPTGGQGQLCEDEASDAECQEAITDNPDVAQNKVSDDCAGKPKLATLCRKRCLSCCKLPEYSCDDNLGGMQPLTCAQVKAQNLCNTNITDLKKTIVLNCPQTCGLCTSSSCRDYFPVVCEAEKAKCGTTQMDSFCPKTCNKCSQLTECVDAARNCAENKALCKNTLYVDLMAQECKSTCNLCKN